MALSFYPYSVLFNCSFSLFLPLPPYLCSPPPPLSNTLTCGLPFIFSISSSTLVAVASPLLIFLILHIYFIALLCFLFVSVICNSSSVPVSVCPFVCLSVCLSVCPSLSFSLSLFYCLFHSLFPTSSMALRNELPRMIFDMLTSHHKLNAYWYSENPRYLFLVIPRIHVGLRSKSREFNKHSGMCCFAWE